MFATSDLAAWLADAGISAAFYFDGQDLTHIEQDVAVVLALRGGGPTILERTFDRPTVQVLTRGAQRDPQGTEALVASIDNALMAVTVTTIGETRVISLDRLGGPPSLLSRDTANRDIFTCSYTFQAARTVF
jgi:hypothetical protein